MSGCISILPTDGLGLGNSRREQALLLAKDSEIQNAEGLRTLRPDKTFNLAWSGAIIPQKQTAAASRNIFKVAARWRRNCCCTLLQLPQSAFACYTAHALCRDRCFADIKVQVCGIPPAMKNLACGMSEASLRFPVSKVDGRKAANNVSPANRENAAHPSVCRHFRNTRFWHSQI